MFYTAFAVETIALAGRARAKGGRGRARRVMRRIGRAWLHAARTAASESFLVWPAPVPAVSLWPERTNRDGASSATTEG
jgi:hypothetical protein